MPGFPVRHYLLEFMLRFMSLESVILSNHPPLPSPSPLAFNLPPASGPFPMSQLFASSGQIIGASALASVDH